MEKNNGQKGNAGISALALIVAIIALVVGWLAYNRTGENLEARVAEEVDQATAEIRADLGRISDALQTDDAPGTIDTQTDD